MENFDDELIFDDDEFLDDEKFDTPSEVTNTIDDEPA
jgi:hypothetical protein